HRKVAAIVHDRATNSHASRNRHRSSTGSVLPVQLLFLIRKSRGKQDVLALARKEFHPAIVETRIGHKRHLMILHRNKEELARLACALRQYPAAVTGKIDCAAIAQAIGRSFIRIVKKDAVLAAASLPGLIEKNALAV